MSFSEKGISPGVERVLNIWSSRKIYDIEFIDQLHAALLTNRTPDTLRQKLLAEYKVDYITIDFYRSVTQLYAAFASHLALTAR